MGQVLTHSNLSQPHSLAVLGPRGEQKSPERNENCYPCLCLGTQTHPSNPWKMSKGGKAHKLFADRVLQQKTLEIGAESCSTRYSMTSNSSQSLRTPICEWGSTVPTQPFPKACPENNTTPHQM